MSLSATHILNLVFDISLSSNRCLLFKNITYCFESRNPIFTNPQIKKKKITPFSFNQDNFHWHSSFSSNALLSAVSNTQYTALMCFLFLFPWSYKSRRNLFCLPSINGNNLIKCSFHPIKRHFSFLILVFLLPTTWLLSQCHIL